MPARSAIGHWSGGLVCALLASWALLAAPAAAQPRHTDRMDAGPDVFDGCGKAAAMRSLAESGLDPFGDPEGNVAFVEASDDTDVLHYNLDIEIFPGTSVITGTNTIDVKSLVDGLTEFTVRLRSNYTISSATIGGTPLTVTSTGTYGRTVTLDRTYNTDEQFTLVIAYSGTAVSRGFGSIEFTQQNGSGPTIVYTLSEPYFSATWWPAKDGDYGLPGNNADKATVELAVTAPDNLETVSNGLLQGIDVLSGSRKRYRWATNYPIATYLVCFASSEFNTWTETYNYTGGSMPVIFNIYPADDTTGNRNAWNKVLTMLDTYGELYGTYPFINEKYGIYDCEFNGGMEHQTNTAQGTFSESVTAHELAHQWWGDNVTCRTWSDIWLNEGFATYSEALWNEYKTGVDDPNGLHYWMAIRRPSSVGDSVYVYDTSNSNRIFSSTYSYHKGGWVLHQLRHVVGDTAFFDSLAAYRAAFEGSGATTDDFANTCSAVVGSSMNWFFDEWVYGIGAPTYSYAWQNVSINGQQYLRLYIDQTQSASYGIYTMPIDVRVNYGGTNETFVVWNDEWTEHFVIPIASAATGVTLDPHDFILNEGKSQVSFVNGPPKVVQAAPAPGDDFDSMSSPTQATITFSENVSASNSDFSVVGDTVGTVAFSYSYSASNFTATLDFGGQLAADHYTITVADSVVSSAAGIALDGEIAGGTLPSGEGLTGGDAVYTFFVAGPCPGDLNGDLLVDLTDLGILLGNYGTGTTPTQGDLDGSGAVDLTDLGILLGQYGVSCN